MKSIKQGLIVSCQALENEPLHSSFIMSKMALGAVEGGACGIRANTVEDIEEIKKNVDVPIIGIIKKVYGECSVFITPTFNEVKELAEAGVDIIAIDGTKRDRPDGKTLEELIVEVKKQYPNQKLMADISTVEEALVCEQLGFDYIGTTLVGYTEYSRNNKPLDVLKEVISKVKAKVIAEGNINTPDLVVEAYKLGAYSVVVGSMITRPQLITKKFVEEIENYKARNEKNEKYFAFDIGGTGVKYGIVNNCGDILSTGQFKTTDYDNVQDLINKMYNILDGQAGNISAIGISCTGKINELTGTIVGGVEIMKGWINTPLKQLFEERYNMPVYVNNDVKCIGLGELWKGAGKTSNNFICVAIGTGIGGAIINDGKLVSGESNFAGEIGHSILNFNGRSCKCGKNGCFEAYGSMSALINDIYNITGLHYSGKEIFEKASKGEEIYLEAIKLWIDSIARGIANLVHILNPEKIIIGGAVSEEKTLFLDKLQENIKKYVDSEYIENLKLEPAKNFNNAGILGAVYGIKNNIV